MCGNGSGFCFWVVRAKDVQCCCEGECERKDDAADGAADMKSNGDEKNANEEFAAAFKNHVKAERCEALKSLKHAACDGEQECEEDERTEDEEFAYGNVKEACEGERKNEECCEGDDAVEKHFADAAAEECFDEGFFFFCFELDDEFRDRHLDDLDGHVDDVQYRENHAENAVIFRTEGASHVKMIQIACSIGDHCCEKEDKAVADEAVVFVVVEEFFQHLENPHEEADEEFKDEEKRDNLFFSESAGACEEMRQ